MDGPLSIIGIQCMIPFGHSLSRPSQNCTNNAMLHYLANENVCGFCKWTLVCDFMSLACCETV